MKIEIFGIDDDKDVTYLMNQILTKNNIENFRLFNDPEELLNALNENVQICIVDYFLTPEMNGLTLIKKIVEKNRHCWFIMLSAQNDIHVLIDFLNSVNGSRYIAKSPADPWSTALVKHIKDIISQIKYIENYYSNAKKIADGFNDLKSLLKT